MSFDLFFRYQTPPATPKPERFIDYFQDRAHYSLHETTAYYESSDTGVYFNFEIFEPAQTGGDSATVPVTFNLKYIRPHVFALEADPELAAFVDHFDLQVIDPQIDSEENRDYSKSAFVDSWDRANTEAIAAMLRAAAASGEPRQLLTLPRHRIRQIWEWGLHRPELSKRYGERYYVPLVIYVQVDHGVKTASLWPNAVPAALPNTDLVVVPRDELDPEGATDDNPRNVAVIPFGEIEPHLASYEHIEEPCPHWRYDETSPPAEFADLIISQPTASGIPPHLHTDRVLDADLVDRARQMQ